MCSSVALSIFTLLCNHQHHWSSSQSETLYWLNSNFPFPPPSAPGNQRPSFCLYGLDCSAAAKSLQSCPTALGPHISGIIQNLSFCDWLISVGQMVKNPPAMREIRVRSLGQEDLLQKGMATYSSILGASLSQMVKNLPAVWENSAMQETWVQSLGQEDTLEEKMATHSSVLAWRVPWTEEPGRLPSVGSQRVGHEWATNTLTVSVSKMSSGFICAMTCVRICFFS